MRVCRYDDDRIGLVRDNIVFDVTGALRHLLNVRWPVPPGDLFISRLGELLPAVVKAAEQAKGWPLEDVILRSPVANPSKIIGAPVNYHQHQKEAQADAGISLGREIKTIEHYGLFLKANSSLVGPGDGVALRFPERRNDHEVELAVVIGRRGSDIPRAGALQYVAGYAIGLDISVRGTEDRSLRKSVDSYSVLGPWLTTADEVGDPNGLDLQVSVNGEIRQDSNTRLMIFDVEALIAYASSFYTLWPGDIIMTGTPEGVGPIAAGDRIHATVEGLGSMTVEVSAAR